MDSDSDSDCPYIEEPMPLSLKKRRGIEDWTTTEASKRSKHKHEHSADYSVPQHDIDDALKKVNECLVDLTDSLDFFQNTIHHLLGDVIVKDWALPADETAKRVCHNLVREIAAVRLSCDTSKISAERWKLSEILKSLLADDEKIESSPTARGHKALKRAVNK